MSQKLRNHRYEKFAQEIAAGTGPRQAYVIAGYEPDRANHNRLLRRAEVAARIQQLKEEREFAAQAAVMPASAVLEILKNSGIEHINDFFERDAAGNLNVADFQTVPVEVAIAFLRFIRRAFAIKAADGL
jgi:Terminase small subunit